MNLKIITPPTENITLTEVKSHLRITGTEEESLLTSLIKTVRQYCENYTQRALASTVFELNIDRFDDKIVLPMPPVEKIESIKYKNSDGVEAELESSDYIFYNSEPAIIIPAFGKEFPTFEPYPVGAVKIRYTAGYKTSSDDKNLILPEPIRQAELLLIGHYYENREATTTGTITSSINEIPLGIQSLLYPYRIFWLWKQEI